MQKVLHLTLKSQPFEVMLSREKRSEFRKPTKWILSRLLNKDGSYKEYDVIKFTNGYGKDKPNFVCKYQGFIYNGEKRTIKYSNGLKIEIDFDDIEIFLGEIGIRRNIKNNYDTISN